MPKERFTPEQKSKLEKSRTLNDAHLLTRHDKFPLNDVDSASFVVDKNENGKELRPRLELPEEDVLKEEYLMNSEKKKTHNEKNQGRPSKSKIEEKAWSLAGWIRVSGSDGRLIIEEVKRWISGDLDSVSEKNYPKWLPEDFQKMLEIINSELKASKDIDKREGWVLGEHEPK
jgi:hypothetical protein